MIKRLCHHILSALAWLSLLLFAATTALWVRSEFVHDQCEYLVNVAGSLPTMWIQYRSWFHSTQGEVWFEREAVANDSDFEAYRRYWAPRGIHFDPLGTGHWEYANLGSGRLQSQFGLPFPSDTFFEQLGFWADHRQTSISPGRWYHNDKYGIPLWFVATVCAVLPVQRFVIARRRLLFDLIQRRFRREPGHCRKCGYDLRATPDRCPECGTVPSKFPDERRIPIYLSCGSVPELARLPKSRRKEIWRQCRNRQSPSLWFWLAITCVWLGMYILILQQAEFDFTYWLPAVALAYWGIVLIVARHIRIAESLPAIRSRVASLYP